MATPRILGAVCPLLPPRVLGGTRLSCIDTDPGEACGAKSPREPPPIVGRASSLLARSPREAFTDALCLWDINSVRTHPMEGLFWPFMVKITV